MSKNKVIFSIFMVALLLFGIIGLEYYEYIAEGKIAGFNIADCRVLTSGLSIETQIFIGIYAVYVYIFCNCFKISGQISIVITSFILAIFSVFGRCLVVTGSIYVAVSRGGTVLSCISIISLGLLYYTILSPIFQYLAEGCILTREMQMKRKARGAIIISFFVLILAWLPWVISYLPGSDCPDLGGQLRQFLGITDYSTHHPIVSTLIYGTIYSIGMLLGSGDFGYLFIVIVQTLGFAAVCAYEAYEVGVLTNSHTAYRITIAFFAILPVFGSYCQWCVKDSLFAIAFGLYATLVAMCVINPNKFFESKRQLTVLCMAAIATGLLRNNGLYAVAFSLPFLALLRPKGKRFRMTIILIVTVLIILITNATVKIVTNASSDTIKESFSIPFQQTARYVREHSDEVTDSEREAINAVLDYENLATLYNEDTSDPVKATYKSTATMQDVIRYLRTWISQGLKSPKCYLCATLRQTYGYWYPEQGIATHDFEFCAYVMFENVAELRDTTYWMPEALRTFCQNWRKIFNAIPIAGYFLTPGIYTWLLVLEAGYLVWRKNTQNLLILLPCIVLTLTCIAGPLNGSVRYSLGVITAMPVCLAASMFTS